MKTTRSYLTGAILFGATLLFSSCGGGENNQDAQDETSIETEETMDGEMGDDLSEDTTMVGDTATTM